MKKTNSSNTINILFCGIGGQGILKASELCSWAAIFQGFHVKKSEVHGMAQRGGSVDSHLRIGNEILSPLIPKGKANFLISFHKDEHDRLIAFLDKKGMDLIKGLEQYKQKFSDERYLNTYLVGVLSKYLPIDEENWVKALELSFNQKHLEDNKKVFFEGRGN